MKLLARLNLGQRILMVIALGGVIYFLGFWLETIHKQAFGWVAYAPLSGATSALGREGGLTYDQSILVWIGLVVLWAVLSMVVLHTPKRSGPVTSSDQPG